MEIEMMMIDDELTGSWTELPLDLLSLIFNKVMSFSLSDYVRFGAVCLEWRSFFITENYEHIKLPNKLPVLLIPSSSHPDHQPVEEEMNNLQQEEGYDYYNPRDIWLGLNHEQRHQNTRSFYSIFDKKLYDFQLPIPSYLNCRGSSHGWLVVVEKCIDGTYPVHLLNPFRSDNNNNKNKNKIHLPPLTSIDPHDEVYHSYFLNKAILSADPSSSSSLFLSNPTTTTTTTTIADDELVVLGLCGSGHLRFCRPGDTSWTALPETIYQGLKSDILNITCYRGQFWVILQDGCAVAFDISPLLPKPNVTTIIDPSQCDNPYTLSRYLVESAGNLYQVRREMIYTSDDDDDYGYLTAEFYVFKLDWASRKWVKTNSLDGHMFFLGNNASISLSASDYYFSGGGGLCKPNSIYFTDDYSEGYGSKPGYDGPRDLGIFNLDSGRFERLEPYYILESRHIMPAPIWIQPIL